MNLRQRRQFDNWLPRKYHTTRRILTSGLPRFPIWAARGLAHQARPARALLTAYLLQDPRADTNLPRLVSGAPQTPLLLQAELRRLMARPAAGISALLPTVCCG